jgi:hypothetical protein
MKKLPNLFLILFLFITSHSFSQYQRGVIITLENDTIKGLINDTQVLKSTPTIEFIDNQGKDLRKFSPTELKGFITTSGVYYESHQFKFDADLLDSALTYPGYPTTPVPVKWLNTSAFLEVLAKGQLSLYKYKDRNNRIHYFIREEGKTELVELVYRTYKVEIKGVIEKRTSEAFKQQLLNYSTKCAELKKQILTTDFNDRRLTLVVKEINKCFNNDQVVIFYR